MFQAANGVETQVIDGKVEIENGNVPEDRAANAEQSDTISPFHIPSMGFMCLFYEGYRLQWREAKCGIFAVVSVQHLNGFYECCEYGFCGS